MEVYTFDKTVMERYKDCCMALKFSDSILAASEIFAAWQYYLSVLLEPTGWQALWRLTRPFCEELQIRYPTVVYGIVEQIDFKECKAQFKVEAVPDEDIDLQIDTHFINLEELWPTIRQENDALNVKTTAEGLDNYRFFMTNIWQPWDADVDDDSIDYIDTHFMARAQLYCDMKNKRMSRNSIARLKLLISEAREVAFKRNRLENEYLEEEDDEDEEDTIGNEEDITMKTAGGSRKRELLRLNIRMNQIKTDFEILENPNMRKVFEESLKECDGGQYKKAMQATNVIVMKQGTIEEQMDYLSAVKTVLGKDETVIVRSSLQEALLNATSAADLIFIPHSAQTIKYPLALEDGGSIKAIHDDQLKAIVACEAEDQNLFVCGNYQFENLTLDCRNVDIGVLVKPKATVIMKNCVIIGGKQASTNQGICVREGGKLILENCRFEDHSTGITARNGGEVCLKGCSFANCTVGVDVTENCELTIENVTFNHEDGKYGVYLETERVPEGKNKEVYKSFDEAPSLPGLHLSGLNKGNICLVKRFLDDSVVIMD